MTNRRAAAIVVAVLTAGAAAAVIAFSGGQSGNASTFAHGPGSAGVPSQNTPPGGGGDDADGGFQGMPGRGLGAGPAGGRGPGGLEAAATYLGVDEQTLFSELGSGKTLAQIAEATSGKSEEGLVAAMVGAQQKQLDAAVESGSLTQAQADEIAAGLEARVTAMVEGTFGRGRGGFPGHPRSGDDGSLPGWGDDGSQPGSADGAIS